MFVPIKKTLHIIRLCVLVSLISKKKLLKNVIVLRINLHFQNMHQVVIAVLTAAKL